MKVVSINGLPKFDIRLNQQYEMVMPSVVKTEPANNFRKVDIQYQSDWKSFLNTDEILELTIWNSGNLKFDSLIDFENPELCLKIQYLTIAGSIGSISDKICRLANLKYLYVYDVSYISPLIGSLKKLEELVLANCHYLDFIPFELYGISSLKKLTINKLGYYENFSPKIPGLINLEYLTLKEHFPFIADEISQLPKLKCLDIERARESIYDIPNLEVLHLRIFDSHSLNGIKRLSKLIELWLDIREFNDEISSLTSLKYLIIFNFPKSSLPDLSKLYNLELLVFDRCIELTEIPEFVFKLPNLKYLGLRSLTSLKSVPTEINNISTLKYLELSGAGETGSCEIPIFRNGLFVYSLNSWNTYERIN